MRLPRENNKHSLRDFLRQIRVANLPQRDRMDQVDTPGHQRGKRLPGIVPKYLSSSVMSSVITPIHLRRR